MFQMNGISMKNIVIQVKKAHYARKLEKNKTEIIFTSD